MSQPDIGDAKGGIERMASRTIRDIAGERAAARMASQTGLAERGAHLFRLSSGLVWFCFGSRPEAQRADVVDKVQRLSVVLRGGYAPQHLEAVAGLQLEIVCDRQESGNFASRVVFPDFGVSAALPAYVQVGDVLLVRPGEDPCRRAATRRQLGGR